MSDILIADMPNGDTVRVVFPDGALRTRHRIRGQNGTCSVCGMTIQRHDANPDPSQWVHLDSQEVVCGQASPRSAHA